MAIVLGKQVYGGIGQNLFNPAMVARVTLLVSFPLEMTTWIKPAPPFSAIAPGPLDALAITFGGAAPVDGATGATVIGFIKTELSQGRGLSEALGAGQFGALSAWLGWSPGSLGETSALLVRRRPVADPAGHHRLAHPGGSAGHRGRAGDDFPPGGRRALSRSPVASVFGG